MRDLKLIINIFKGNKLSKNKGLSDISANRYSLALFELASETSVLPHVEQNSFAFLNLISNDNEFNNLIKDLR